MTEDPSMKELELARESKDGRESPIEISHDFEIDSDDIFALDEDTKGLPTKKKHFTDDFEEHEESEDEFGEAAMTGRTFSASSRLPARSRHSGRGGAFMPNPSARLPSSSIAASLPVKINSGFWPPEDAIDSIPDEDSDVESRPKAKTILPQRDDEDIYRNIQAYSRSIQPADDPERLFGERPRRRYRTGENGNNHEGGSSVVESVASRALPMAVAPDLNNAAGFTADSTNNTPRPRVIIPSSLTGHF